MAKAIVGDTVLAESDTFELVEGNIYFPPEAINKEYFTPTDLQTSCPWKGVANYYTIEADGKTLENAAWFYPEPKKAAENIRDHVAFYGNKVTIEK